MKYIKRNDKYIFDKDGVYLSMTEPQVKEMRDLCNEILGKHSFRFKVSTLGRKFIHLLTKGI